jgi:hypothetical protein
VGLFDWFGRGRSQASPPLAWHVYCDAADIVAEDGRGGIHRAPLAGARSVRVVPLMAGNHHGQSRGGWQVALARSDGDVLIGTPLADWRSARDLARRLCETSELPLDELTEKLFSRVGQFTPTEET